MFGESLCCLVGEYVLKQFVFTVFSDSSGGMSPVGAVFLGIFSAVVVIVVVVLVYKYQRRLMYAIRFRRLQEVPMVCTSFVQVTSMFLHHSKIDSENVIARC